MMVQIRELIHELPAVGQWKTWLISGSIAFTGLVSGGWLESAIAQTSPDLNQGALSQIDAYTGVGDVEAAPEDGMALVTSVSQLSDVQPTDWAFPALQSLVERYGCIAGYPDGTFKGGRALSRYEFAAGLNACMDRINELIAQGTANLVTKDDLMTLKKLQEEFANELATLKGRVDGLATRVTTLESQQFSTTTKLFGQAIFGIQGRTSNRADFFPVDGVRDTDDPGTNINFISNVQLSLYTQFSPNSLLLTGLAVGTGNTAPRLTNDTRLSYESQTNNQLVLSDLTYRQLFGRNFAVIVGPAGVNMVNVFRGANRVESAGFGPISAFAQRNPILSIGAGTAGLGIDWQIANPVSLQAVYSTSLPQDPLNGGLFGSTAGDTTIGLQLTLAPTKTIDVALNYVNAFSPAGSLRTGVGDDQLTVGAGLNTNAFGATAAWRITPRVTIGTWGGYTTSTIPNQSGTVETTNWMVFLNFPDLFGQGNLGGIYVGQPPKITGSNLPTGFNIPNLLAAGTGTVGGRSASTTHVELFYRHRLSDNITLSPGVIFIFSPSHTASSDTITIGALRTTFTF